MRLEQFFEKFGLFAQAPGAVARMRELIRYLAIRGKLVPQDPEDPPASALLDSIVEHKAALSREGKFRGTNIVTPMAKEEGDFEIPLSWALVRFGEVLVNRDGERIPVSKEERVNKKKTYDYYGASGVIDKIDRYLFDKPLLLIGEDGANLVNRSTPIAFMARGKYWVNNHAHVLDGISEDFLRYIELHINAINLEPYVTGSAQPKMNQAKMNSIPIALPPLAEQKRIVAKVDELMALCDRLEAQQQERETRHAALARAALARFAEAPTPANLDFLFHPSYAITPADLRKTILTLAVQGKLVPQDPNDEPAEAGLVRLGLKSTHVLSDEAVGSEDSLPFSWTQVRFEDVALVAGGVTLGRKLGARKTVSLPYLRVANVKRGEIDLSVIKEVTIAEDEIERYALRENDLLMTEGGDWDKVGRAAIWKAQIPICLHQNHVFRARMRSDEIDPVWFERYFNSPDGRGYFESAAKQTTNLASINMRQVRSCPAPFPPLAEQRRIVAKVDQLMALVDQLEAQLAEAGSQATALLDAALHELLNPSAEIIDLAAYRVAVGCYAIGKMHDKPYFGRTAAAKVLFLAQAHVGLKLGFKPLRDAAGPLDQWIYRFQEEAEQEGWFTFSERPLAGDKYKVDYRPGPGLAEQTAQAERLLSKLQRQELDRLLALLSDKTTEEAEIIATLFAAWNDFLIDGHDPGEDEIVSEVRENWHVSKQRFGRDRLRQWLGWLRANDLVPRGRGPHTIHQVQIQWH